MGKYLLSYILENWRLFTWKQICRSVVYLATWAEKNCNARGVFATATYKRGPYLTSGSLLRGSDRSPHKEVGATLLGSPRPTYHNPRAAGSKQHSWSSWLAGHFLLHHNRGTKWLANPNSIIVNFKNCFILFNFLRGAVKWGRTTYPCDETTPHPDIWTAWAQAGNL